jgi:hypothetical protein
MRKVKGLPPTAKVDKDKIREKMMSLTDEIDALREENMTE